MLLIKEKKHRIKAKVPCPSFINVKRSNINTHTN